MLKCLIKLAGVLAYHFKDGVQATDAIPIVAKLQEPEIQALLLEAYNGVDKVPSEAVDLEFSEMLELLASITPEIVDLVQSLRK
jgi:hypothetical protein